MSVPIQNILFLYHHSQNKSSFHLHTSKYNTYLMRIKWGETKGNKFVYVELSFHPTISSLNVHMCLCVLDLNGCFDGNLWNILKIFDFLAGNLNLLFFERNQKFEFSTSKFQFRIIGQRVCSVYIRNTSFTLFI